MHTATLLLVDGSNILMRCAFGGEIAPAQSTPTAVAMIERSAKAFGATHLIIALDHPDSPSWRKQEYADYKAQRTTDTSSWIVEGAAAFSRRGWQVVMLAGYEADDLIATIARRSVGRASVVVLSNDSDLLPLTADGARIARPVPGGEMEVFTAADVCEKYDVRAATALLDFKAMVGEKGDNVPGVPGIGPKRACALLAKFDALEAIIAAGEGGYNRDAEVVARHSATARRALRLVTLRTDAPVEPIPPSRCSYTTRTPRG